MKKQLKRKCFVIMPISKTRRCTTAEWTGIFEQMIKPAVMGSRLGFDCERAKPRTGNFIKDIVNQLNTAHVVIADLTDMNPNVFYELGVRHTLKTRTILIAQGKKYVPSDLQAYWVIIYEKDLTGLEDFKRKIREILREIEKNPEKSDSPVADFLIEKNINLLSFQKKMNLARLSALVSELSFNITLVGTVLDIIAKSEQIRKEQKNKYYTTNARFDNACLELLLSTQYIILPKPLVEKVRRINHLARLINNELDLWGGRDPQATEKILKEELPSFNNDLLSLLNGISKLRLDYTNDNYIEPRMPTILLSSPEHQKYIEATK